MPHVAVIDKEILLGTTLAGRLGSAHEAMNGDQRGLYIDWQELVGKALTEDSSNTGLQR